MKPALKRIRGAALLGLAWAVAWAPLAVLIGVTIIDPDNSMDEMWVVIGAYPGFLCGAISYLLIARKGRLGAQPIARAGALGAFAGLLVGMVPFLLGSSDAVRPVWQLAAMTMSAFGALSAISALVSVMIARMRSTTAAASLA